MNFWLALSGTLPALFLMWYVEKHDAKLNAVVVASYVPVKKSPPRSSFASLIEHQGRKGTPRKTTGLTFVSKVSFVFNHRSS